jgi:DNA-binding response OmpR family regulator
MHTLLLADDSITVQRVIALTFAGEPIEVVAVSDGRQAMEKLAAQRPDIVLAATTLSQMSGYDLAHFVRSTADLQGVPVLLLSGAFETVDEAKLKTSGANGVIEKPVEPIAVIARVKELLGLKSAAKPATVGRLVTSADGVADKKLATPSNWEELRERTGLDANTRSVEAPSTRSKSEQQPLEVAFDSLDQQLSGRAPQGTHNPSGPLGHAGGAADPRSPGRRPDSNSTPGNPVFEVDDQWFSGEENRDQAEARAGRREIIEDLRSPEFQAAPAAPDSTPAPIFEVDDEWFADGNKARANKLDEQRQLAAEMGIHDVDLPQAEAPLEPAPVAGHDFEFGLDDLKALQQPDEAAPVADVSVDPAAAGEAVTLVEPLAHVEPAPLSEPETPVEATPIEPFSTEPVAIEPMIPNEPAAPFAPAMPVSTTADLAAIAARADAHGVADDFAALLAYEQGESPAPIVTPAPVAALALQITDEMLDQIASRVAERLSAGLFGDQLKIVVTDTVRDTVRTIVSDTSERLVRDEIDRIKNRD